MAEGVAGCSGILRRDFYFCNNARFIFAYLEVAVSAYDFELLSLRHNLMLPDDYRENINERKRGGVREEALTMREYLRLMTTETIGTETTPNCILCREHLCVCRKELI